MSKNKETQGVQNSPQTRDINAATRAALDMLRVAELALLALTLCGCCALALHKKANGDARH